MAAGRAKESRLVGRYQLVFEIAQSYLGPLWAVCTEGDGPTSRAILRLVSLARLDADTRVSLLEAGWQAMEVRSERVCAVTDVVASDGEVGVVSEYAEGLPLRAVQGIAGARRKPFTPDIALRVILDMAVGVAALHAASKELGDEAAPLWGGLSPDSILLCSDGRSLLMDPAISSVSSTVPTLGGNPERAAYSSPEQLGTPPRADPRSDVFTLGIIAWELLSNRRLFLGADKAVAQKVLTGKIPRLEEVKRKEDPELPAAVVAAVMKALERDPARRFQTPEEFHDAIAQSTLAAASVEQVAAYVESIGDGAFGRLREALKDESTGTRAGASVAKAAVAARASITNEVKSDAQASKSAPKAAEKAIAPIRIEAPKAVGVAAPADVAKKPAAPVAPPPPPIAAPPAAAEAPKAPPAAPAGKGHLPKRLPTMIGMVSPLAGLAQKPAGPLPAAPAPMRAPEPPGDFVAEGAPISLAPTSEAETVPPVAGLTPRAFEDLSSLDGEEPTGQFTAKDLQRVEQMARKSEPAKHPSGITEPEKPTFPASLGVAPKTEDIAWLDEPESVRPNAGGASATTPSPAQPNAFVAPKGAFAPPPNPFGASGPTPAAFPKADAGPPRTMSKGAMPAVKVTEKTPAPAGASVPPSGYYPSQIPPPLIHDPRAKGPETPPTPKVRADGKKKKKRNSPFLIGALLSIGLVAASAAGALFVLRTRDAKIEENNAALRGSYVLAAPPATAAAPPVAAPTAEPSAAAAQDAAAPVAASATAAPTAAPASAPAAGPAPANAGPVLRAAPVRRAPAKKKRYVPSGL